MVQEYRPAWLLTLVTLGRVSTEADSLEEAQLGRDLTRARALPKYRCIVETKRHTWRRRNSSLKG